MRLLSFALLLLSVIFVMGCGGDSAAKRGIPPLVPCALTFLYEDDSPIEDASIQLQPDAADNKWLSSGFTSASGIAEMKTDGDFLGVPKGTYKVTCSKTQVIPTGKINEEGDEINDSKPLVAKEFTRPNTTPLTITVADAPVNEVFKVKKP